MPGLLTQELLATCVTIHMCNNKKSFSALYELKEPIDVVLGDGHSFIARESCVRYGFTKW